MDTMSARNAGVIDGVSVKDPITPTDNGQFPELPAQQTDYLQNAPGFNNDDYNEAKVFNAMYDEAAMAYYPEAVDVQARGRQVLRLFSKYKPLASAFVRAALRGDNVDDNLSANIAFEPEGSTEAIVRPLGEWTFSNAAYTFTPGATGEFEYIPNTTNAATETATANEQAWMIFGFIDYAAGNVVPYDYIQSTIDDSLGTRRPFQLRNQMTGPGVLKVADRDRGPLTVFPGRTLDMDLNVVNPDVQSGLFPVGIEVIVETASEFAGIQD